ncbi:gamma-butyrobetaine dioxygenase-like isoform X2 [Neocloeon triangulifer]|uniref:gamma-butyrobetaine dioxygenase-like isoform X2 n=1 Tax=Neocloeon triangulifer TaxID=2078957 RepID=UPI00286F0FDC|nr:gamma-butyrobetaine dioxygenase-like isoform X2 [Neocloeon triangulifer]
MRFYYGIISGYKVHQRSGSSAAAKLGVHPQQRRVAVSRARLQRHLELTWLQGSSSSFPLTWLRDNCQCPKCFHPDSKSRTVDWATCDITIKPKEVQVSDDGKTVIVDWLDAHSSRYSAEWLHSRRFEEDARKKWLSTYKQEKEIWQSAEETEFPRKRFSFEGVMSDDGQLLQWMLELERFGVAVLEGAGCDDERTVRKLADRVAFIRRTHYGEEFSVKSKMEPSNVAYTGQALQLHTDLPYYEYKPGVNMLHCLVQAEGEGGENQLVDSLRVAGQLKQSHPEFYKALSTIPVDWTDEGVEEGRPFRSLYRAPVICEDSTGKVFRVNYSQPQRDSHFSVPVEQVETWYLALKQFTQLMLRADNRVEYKVKPGEILSFDNLRICHGRSGYTPAVNQIYERHIVGAYLDWDEIRCRIRVLSQREQ